MSGSGVDAVRGSFRCAALHRLGACAPHFCSVQQVSGVGQRLLTSNIWHACPQHTLLDAAACCQGLLRTVGPKACSRVCVARRILCGPLQVVCEHHAQACDHQLQILCCLLLAASHLAWPFWQGYCCTGGCFVWAQCWNWNGRWLGPLCHTFDGLA